MRRCISVFLIMVLIFCSLPTVASATMAELTMNQFFDGVSPLIVEAIISNATQTLDYVRTAEFELEPGSIVNLGRYYMDAIDMSISYSPGTVEIDYGVCTNFTSSGRLWYHTATGGSGSGSLSRDAGYYYVFVANRSDETVYVEFEFIESATVR